MLGLFLGKNVNLFSLTTPPVDYSDSFLANIPILGPLVVALHGTIDNNNTAVLFARSSPSAMTRSA